MTSQARVSDNLNYRESLFSEGKKMFQIKSYDASYDKLNEFKKSLGLKSTKSDLGIKDNSAFFNSEMVEEADYMICLISFEKNYKSAIADMKSFIDKYPGSKYKNTIKYYIGSTYFYNEEYSQAKEMFEDTDLDLLSIEDQPLYLLRLGISYLKTEDAKSAKPIFMALESTGSVEKYDAIYYNSYINYCEGNFDAALKGFRELPAKGEYSKTSEFYIAQILFIKGDYTEASKAALSLLNENPTDEQRAEMHRILGIINFKNNNYQQANEYLKNYMAIVDDPMPESAIYAGISAYECGKFKDAISYLSYCVAEENELKQQAYLYMGHASLHINDNRNAMMFFEAASQSDFNRSLKEEAMYNYGLLVHSNSYSAFNESVTVFERFLNQFPGSKYSDKVNDCLVESYMTTRNYQAALESIEKIKNPGNKILAAKQRVLFQLGTQNFANSDMESAENYFSKAILIGNYDRESRALAFFWRGECLYRKGFYNQAESDFKQYQMTTNDKRNEVFALARYNTAYCCYKQHRFDEAIQWFERYVAIGDEKSKNTYTDALIRMGDSHFYRREFSKAQDCYLQASVSGNAGADYALFQRGFMAGLQKKYKEKINVMQSLVEKYPESEFADDALFEEGKTYMQIDNKSMAKKSFKLVTTKYPNGSLARQAGLRLALAHFNDSEYNQAIEAYKNVIEKYSGSEEAKIAIEDLKAVYLETNEVQNYADYVNNLGGKVIFGEGEQDSLTYFAAEKVMLRGNDNDSRETLVKYIQTFENGAFKLDAYCELGRIYYKSKDYDNAIEAYGNILQYQDSKHIEEALVRSGEMYFIKNEMKYALSYYKDLTIKAEKRENKEAARVGILRCNVALGENDEIVLAANDLLTTTNLSPELTREALYCRAKALINLERNDYAIKDLQELAKDMRSAQGAEAGYLVAQINFNNGEIDKAEQGVFALIDSATPQQYWLARGFILLADIYIEKGDNFQAKQYLQNLKNNYSAQDEISEMIEERFNKMGE